MTAPVFWLESTAPMHGEDVLRMFVTGGPPMRGGGGMPQRILVSARPESVLRTTGAGLSGNTPGIGGRLPT